MKSVVCVLGSPRKDGNTAAIAATFAETAHGLGADVQTFVLNELDFRGCQACMACKTGAEFCIVQDDLTRILAAVAEADVTVMASPIYFGQVTGQLKCFLDRTYSYLKPDFMTNPSPLRLAPGKKIVFITTQGNPDASQYNAAAGYAGFFKTFGVETHIIRGLGMNEKGTAATDAELMRQAGNLARTVLV